MENKEKVINLLKKLKALADKGVGGEKLNAERMMLDIMQKHNITISDIEGEAIEWFDFKISSKTASIFWQIVGNVIADWNREYKHSRTNKLDVSIEMTHAQYIEIEAKCNFYKKDYEKQLKENIRVFEEAYIYKNKLFMSKTKNTEDEPETDPKVDLAHLQKVLNTMEGIDKANYYKQISK